MADTRYLKRRHQSWYFVAAVPRALRGNFVSEGRNGTAGRPLSKIVVSLKTQSLREAQDRRWPLVKQWRETFQRAQAGEPLSLAEIDAQAREIFTSTLERMEVDAKRRRLSINEERESLNEGLYSFLEDMGLVSPDPGEPDTPIDDLMSFDAIGPRIEGRRTADWRSARARQQDLSTHGSSGSAGTHYSGGRALARPGRQAIGTAGNLPRSTWH